MRDVARSPLKWGSNLAIVSCCLALVLSVHCSSDRPCDCGANSNPGWPPWEGITPLGVLAQAYETKNAEVYGLILAEDYAFCFPKQSSDGPEIAGDTCLTKALDLASAVNMFGDSRVTSIDVDFLPATGWSLCRVGGHDCLCCVVSPEITVTIGEPETAAPALTSPLDHWTWARLKTAFSEGGQRPEEGTYHIGGTFIDVAVTWTGQPPFYWTILRMTEYQ
jgi:hypothetical protein